MERTVFARWAPLALAALALACSPADRDPAPAAGEGPWLSPPSVERAVRQGGDIVLIGRAPAEARVMISGAGGAAHGADADSNGRFRVAIPRPTRAMLMTIESRASGLRAREAGRLLVTADGLAAMLTPGGPSRLLSGGERALIVDHDGRAATVSGTAAPGREVAIAVNGQVVARATADGAGVFTVAAAPLAGAGRLTLDGLDDSPLEVAIQPPTPAADGLLEVTTSNGQTGVSWPVPGGGWQRTVIVAPTR